MRGSHFKFFSINTFKNARGNKKDWEGQVVGGGGGRDLKLCRIFR